MDIFFGSIILEFIGAIVKWVWYWIINSIQGRKSISFMSVWRGRKHKDEMSYILGGFSNTITGAIVVLGIIFILQIIL